MKPQLKDEFTALFQKAYNDADQGNERQKLVDLSRQMGIEIQQAPPIVGMFNEINKLFEL